MKNKLFYSIVLLVFSLLFLPAVVMGATVTATLNVQANLIAACTVTSSNIDFGDIPNDGNEKWGTGDVSVNCPYGVAYTISLNGGLHQAGSRRQMLHSGSGAVLPYELLGSISGPFLGIDLPALTDTGNGSSQPHAIWGQTFSFGSVPLGIYTDTVTATVAY